MDGKEAAEVPDGAEGQSALGLRTRGDDLALRRKSSVFYVF